VTVRSIINVEVNDAQFKRFSDTFKKYQELLAKTPKMWGEAAEGAKETNLSFQKLVAALLAQSELTKTVAHEHARMATSAASGAKSWREMAHGAKTVAGSVFDITRNMLRWTALTGITSGLLGAGSIWGLDRLAMAASAGRRSSLGLGLTYGEQRAFGVDYSRVVNPDQFLGGVNAALHDLSLRPALYGAGLTEADLRGKDTGQVASALIPALKKIADATPSNQLAQVLAARHLDQFVSLQDMERIKALSPGELADYQKHYGSDAVRLNLTQRQLVAWQRLQVQLTRAGDTIESTFIRGLTPLAPELEKLSKAFTDVVDALFESPAVKEWIKDFASGMESLAKYIGTPQFKQDVQDFVAGVGNMVKAIGAGIKWLAARIPGLQDAITPDARPGVDPKGHRVGPNGGLWQNPDGSIVNPESGRPYKEISPGVFQPSGTDAGPLSDREKEAHDYFRANGWSEAQTAGLLGYIKGESSFNPNAFNPAGGGQGAQGIAQWRGPRIAAFRKMFGHDPKDGTLHEQLQFMQWELINSERGTGNALSNDTDAAQAGADVLRLYGRPSPDQLASLERQRAGYAQGYDKRFSHRQVTTPKPVAPPAVNIYDRTGGSVVVSSAQLAV
jgi:hypothetical protein